MTTGWFSSKNMASRTFSISRLFSKTCWPRSLIRSRTQNLTERMSEKGADPLSPFQTASPGGALSSFLHQGFANYFGKGAGIVGLGQELMDGAVVDRALGHLEIGFAREHDANDIGVLGRDLRQELRAAHARHLPVANHRVHMPLGEDAEGLFRRAGGADTKPL